MSADFVGITLEDITILVEDGVVGFSMNCQKDNRVISFKAKDMPLQLLSIISQRITEDTDVLVNTAIKASDFDESFANILSEKIVSEQKQ